MYDQVIKSVNYIKELVTCKPIIGIVLGSGLGSLVDIIENGETIPYKDIPGFPQSTVKGHAGNLVFGQISGQSVVAMQGRFHYYEGFSMEEVTYPCYVMKLLGVDSLIVTNACGGINQDFESGDLMLIKDIMTLACPNPLIGRNDERFGPRFPEMTEPLSNELMKKAEKAAFTMEASLKQGIYAYYTGPSYESAADIRTLGVWGADAVGMSTVPEIIVANYLGMKVLGLSCITNMGTGIRKEKHSHEEVVRIAEEAGERLCLLLKELLTEWETV